MIKAELLIKETPDGPMIYWPDHMEGTALEMQVYRRISDILVRALSPESDVYWGQAGEDIKAKILES